MASQDLLYHYTPFAGALGILESRSLWASNIHFLNDREELVHGLGLASGIMESRLHIENDRGKAVLTRIREVLSEFRQADVYIVSFTENGDLLSQWRGYASSGGVALGFQRGAIETAGVLENFRLSECVYDDGEKVRIIENLLRYHLDAAQNGADIDALAYGFFSNFYQTAAGFKNAAFSEEREWRLISPIIQPSGEKLGVRVRGSYPVPYFNLPLHRGTVGDKYSIGLSSVIVGPHHESQLIERALRIAVESKRVYAPEFQQSRAPYRSI